MPRKTKDKVEENEKIDKKKKVAKKSTAAKKEPAAKKTAAKKPAAKKAATKKTTAEKDTSEKKTTKTSSKTNKTSSKKNKTPKAKASTKTSKSKDTTTKQTTQKRTAKKAATVEEPATPILEYYDLPYKYGNTVVRLLAQTPKTLFVYWEVSDADIAEFKRIYGDDFFNKTKPVLIVHNLTLDKTTEIEINDYANCWYLNVEETDCKYDIELARKFIKTEQNTDIAGEYLYIAKSNSLQSPNNHILFEKMEQFVVFRNTTTDNTITKNIKSFKFLKDIYKFYKDMYDEDVLNNPSSQFKF